MKKKSCELCSDAATMYCESDSASLCLRCDEKVHGANFLVAKHERSLLCSVCQSVTSWKASGPRLGRAVSVCDGCVCDRNGIGGKVDLQVNDEAAAVEEEEVESRDRSDGDEEPETSSDEEDEDEDDVEEDEDEENQVVPWSSGEGLSSSSICGRELKRRRDISDLDSDEEIEDEGGSSSAYWDRSRRASRLIGI